MKHLAFFYSTSIFAVVMLFFVICSSASADYVTELLALSPDHYYQLNETTSGMVNDTGTNPITAFHSGTYGTGGAEVGVAGVSMPGFAANNKALSCNDMGGIQLGGSDTFAADTMTVSLWMKEPNPTTEEGYSDRLFQNNSDTDPMTICFSKTGSVFVITGTQDADDRQLGDEGLWIRQNAWHNIVMVRNGDNVGDAKLYIDGVDRTSILAETPHNWGNTPDSAWIGCRDAATGLGFMSGQIDEVAIWQDRALTESEISSLYTTAVGPQPTLSGYGGAVLASDPIAFYRFDDPAGLAGGDPVANALVQPSQRIMGAATAGHSFDYPETVPTFGQSGPLPGDTIRGQALSGLDAGNTAAQFMGKDGAVADSTDMIHLGADPAMDVDNMTVSFFFNTESTDSWTRIFVTQPEYTDHDFYILLHEGTLVLAPQRSGSDSLRTIDTYNDGTWHHCVAVREGGTADGMRLFIDGLKVESFDDFSGEGLTSPSSARIGARTSTTTGYKGMLDDFAIWDRALSDTEAVSLFNAAIGGEVVLLPGDTNYDGVVNSEDAATLAANWLGTGKNWGDGDFNNDGTVDDKDATILAVNWHQMASSANVPEPSIISILGGFLVALLAIRRMR